MKGWLKDTHRYGGGGGGKQQNVVYTIMIHFEKGTT